MVLNAKTKNNILKKTGMKVEDIIDMDFYEIDRKIERKIGKTLKHPKKSDIRLMARGSIYFALGRFLSKSKIEKKLLKIR